MEVVATIVLVAAGLGLVVLGTIRRAGRWGINLRRVTCPRCAQPVSAIRAPKTLSQGMWGGATCRCGCVMDKWGRELP